MEVMEAIDHMRDSAARRQINRLKRQSRQLLELIEPLARKRTAWKRRMTATAAAAGASSPAQRLALSLPEICRAIFAQLGPASLAAAARVCRAWFAPAVQALWRQLVPDDVAVDALAAVSGVRTLPYGAAVRELCVRDGSALGIWTFPAVRAVRLYLSAAAGDAAYFTELLGRCGDSLELVEVVTADELAECHALVREDGPPVVDHLRLLARRPGLRALHYREYASSEAMSQAVAGVGSPFRSLMELAVCLRSDAVPAMVTLLGGGASVAVLVLRVALDATAHYWRALSRMSGLREFCIEWYVHHIVTADEFLEFARLPSGLQKLHLINDSSDSPSVLLEHWRTVLSNLPNLVVLRADVRGEFDGAVLRIVGEQCRLIEDLQLRMPCQLWELELSTEEVLFPHLLKVEVDTFTGFERLT
jgi:hypothetical protein